MKTFIRIFLSFLFFSTQFLFAEHEVPSHKTVDKIGNDQLHDADFDLTAIEQELHEKGLKGRIHGSAPDKGLYVFTYGDIFKHIEFSLVARTPATQKQLQSVKRHDKVLIKGEWIKNSSAQPHIKVSEVTVLEAFKDLDRAKYAKFTHQTDLKKELAGKTELEVLVHTVAREGKVLVVEYGDAVIPVVVKTPSLTEDLYRGDRVRIQIQKQNFPARPTHLELNEKAGKPIEMLYSLGTKDGDLVTPEGQLIMFVRSPVIQEPIFGIKVLDKNGTANNYTLMGADSEGIRKRCKEIWKQYESEVVGGRNLYVLPTVTLKVTGRFHMSDRSQAPVVEVEKVEDLLFSRAGQAQ